MSRSRPLLATFIVAAAATATPADAATIGVEGGPSVQLPDAQVNVPQLSPSLPKVQVRVPDVQVPTSRGGTQQTTDGLGGAVSGGGGGYTGSGYSSSGASGSGGGAYSSGTGGSGPVGSGHSGATASSSSSERSLTHRQRRIRAARERRALRRDVRRLRGCLGVVSSFEREVLARRSGLSGPAQSRRQVARALDTSQGRVARGERSGLRGLREAARSTGCEGGSTVTFGDTSSQQVAAATVAVATGDSPPLRSVTAMAGEPSRQVASLDTDAAGQVLGASARSDGGDDELTEGDGPAVAASNTGSPGGDGPPATLFLLLLLLLVPLAFALVRRRSATVFATATPEAPATPERDQRELWTPPATSASVEPAEPAASEHEPVELEPGPAAVEHSGPAEPSEPPPPAPAAVPPRQVAKATPAVQPPAKPGRGRQAAAVASGLASVVLGRMVSRRYRGRRRR